MFCMRRWQGTSEPLSALNTRSWRGFSSKIIHDFCDKEPAVPYQRLISYIDALGGVCIN
jgi:hypothetical protein